MTTARFPQPGDEPGENRRRRLGTTLGTAVGASWGRTRHRPQGPRQAGENPADVPSSTPAPSTRRRRPRAGRTAAIPSIPSPYYHPPRVLHHERPTTVTTPAAITVGVDPGGRESGIVVLEGAELVAAAVLDREVAVSGSHGYSSGAWADANLEAIDKLLDELGIVLDPVEYLRQPPPPPPLTVAVEDVRAPTFHGGQADGEARLTNVDGILDTAIVLGAILARWPDAVLVPPGGNGASLPALYPPPLRPRPGGKGRDRLRHARSAYDVARAARALAGRRHDEEHRAARVVEPTLYRARLDRPTPSVQSRP